MRPTLSIPGISERKPPEHVGIFLILIYLVFECFLRPAIRPNAELQRDDEEGEDSLLCDSEGMDLLGEIFETLSSRNFHERGPLYGTRSLDLFGSDSNDFIMKVRRTRGCKQKLSSTVPVLTSAVALTVRLSVQPQSGEPDSVHERQRQPAQLESGSPRGEISLRLAAFGEKCARRRRGGKSVSIT